MRFCNTLFLAISILVLIAVPVVAEPYFDYYVYAGQFGSSGDGPREFNKPSGFCIGQLPSGAVRIFVADTENDRILVFTPNGTPVPYPGGWGGYGSSDGKFISPSDVAYYNNKVYVVDMLNHRVQKFSTAGVYEDQWGGFGTANGQFKYPTDIAVDRYGDLYVTEKNNNRIQKFDSDGNFITKWGGPGTADGKFDNPTGIATRGDYGGVRIFVTDANNDRVQVFNVNGDFLDKWYVTDPHGIAYMPGNVLFVCRYSDDYIAAFNTSGGYLGRAGRSGDGPGELDMPVDAAVSPDGYLYILDKGNDRIMKFAKSNPVPEITRLNPTNILCDSAGFDLTISGEDFITTSEGRWKINDMSQMVLASTYVSSTELRGFVPASLLTTPGRHNITVRTPAPGGGTSNVLTFRVMSPVPVLTSLNPSSRAHGGTRFNITLTGTNFIPESRVRWNGEGRTTWYESSTSLKVRITAADIASAGTAQINVRNPAPGGGVSNSLPFTIT